jgi:hypothetical protein
LRFQLNKLSLVLSLGDEGSRGAAAFLASAAAAGDPMKSILVKGSHFLLGMDFSCLCQGPSETTFGQRQPFFCGGWISVASAIALMKSILVKGNYVTLESGIQLPLPLTR